MPPYRFSAVDVDPSGRASRSWVDEGRGIYGRITALSNVLSLGFVRVQFIYPEGSGTYTPAYDSIEAANAQIKDQRLATSLLDEATTGYGEPPNHSQVIDIRR